MDYNLTFWIMPSIFFMPNGALLIFRPNGVLLDYGIIMDLFRFRRSGLNSSDKCSVILHAFVSKTL